MKKRFIFIQLCLSLSLVVCQTGFARTPMENVHPGYNLYTIRPDDFEPPTTGLAFNSKGELLITTYHIGDGHNYQMPGEVYLLRGTEGTDRSNIQVIEFANGFQDPMGLFISNDSVYVVSRGAVTVLFDDDGDGAKHTRYRPVSFLQDVPHRVLPKCPDLCSKEIDDDDTYPCSRRLPQSAPARLGSKLCSRDERSAPDPCAYKSEDHLGHGDRATSDHHIIAFSQYLLQPLAGSPAAWVPGRPPAMKQCRWAFRTLYDRKVTHTPA